jgi:hypothetical protein
MPDPLTMLPAVRTLPGTISYQRGLEMDAWPNYLRRRISGLFCVYCGQWAGSDEHFPPRSAISSGVILPACIECNGLAGNFHPFDFESRVKHVKDRLRSKYRKLLDSPDWSEEELEEVDYTLDVGGRAWRKLRKIVRERIAWNAMSYLSSIDDTNDFADLHAEIDFMRARERHWSRKQKDLASVYAPRPYPRS